MTNLRQIRRDTACRVLTDTGGSRTAPTTIIIMLVLLLLAVIPAQAQDGEHGEHIVTYDEVNAVASKLYCPVCENIPLDVCPTLACTQWREEIRQQLADGKSEQQIIDDFIRRYGELVVGTPQDPLLRGLSLITPVLLGMVAIVGAWLAYSSRRGAMPATAAAMQPAGVAISDIDYRAQIENDLMKKR